VSAKKVLPLFAALLLTGAGSPSGSSRAGGTTSPLTAEQKRCLAEVREAVEGVYTARVYTDFKDEGVLDQFYHWVGHRPLARGKAAAVCPGLEVGVGVIVSLEGRSSKPRVRTLTGERRLSLQLYALFLDSMEGIGLSPT
jgi:hypothetical protein